MSSSKITAAFKAEFAEALRLDKKVPYNELLQTCLDILKKHKLCYVQTIDASQMLVHHKNRGGLMLSVHNVHANAAVIHTVGADRSQLNNAVCFELADDGEQRTINLAKNEALIQRSNGFLAAINGFEKYISVGCGHTTAFTKLAKVGGKTVARSLQDDDGNIDIRKLRKNAEFRAMLDEGWPWTVMSSAVDIAFPAFAKVAQKALNVNNHVAQKTGELEMALGLVDLCSDPGFQEEPDWKGLACQSMLDQGIPAGPYARVILDFALEYGGGAQVPELKFMHNVASQFGCSRVLGETFWTALTRTSFSDKTSLYPLLRVALALCNLSAEKTEDDIAKLLTKSDVTKVASKAKATEAKQAEETLSKAKSIVAALAKDQNLQHFSEEVALMPLGQIFVRTGLWLAEKGNASRERVSYTLKDIKILFLKALSNFVGRDVQYPPWFPKEEEAEDDAPSFEPVSDSAKACSAAEVPATLEDHSQPTWVAKKAGFEIGMSVYERLDTPATIERVFDILNIDGDKVKLVGKCAFDGNHQTIEITLGSLLSKWSVTKLEAPVNLKVCDQYPDFLAMERQKCIIYGVISDMKMSGPAGSLELWRLPDMVRTGPKAICKDHFLLVPIIALANITAKNIAGSGLAFPIGKYDVNDRKVQFYITPPPKPTFDPQNATKVSDDVILSAFFWVSTTSDKSEANLQLEEKTIKGITVPVLRNHVNLKPFSRLYRFVAPKAKASEVQPEPAPKKKARTSK